MRVTLRAVSVVGEMIPVPAEEARQNAPPGALATAIDGCDDVKLSLKSKACRGLHRPSVDTHYIDSRYRMRRERFHSPLRASSHVQT